MNWSMTGEIQPSETCELCRTCVGALCSSETCCCRCLAGFIANQMGDWQSEDRELIRHPRSFATLEDQLLSSEIKLTDSILESTDYERLKFSRPQFNHFLQSLLYLFHRTLPLHRRDLVGLAAISQILTLTPMLPHFALLKIFRMFS